MAWRPTAGAKAIGCFGADGVCSDPGSVSGRVLSFRSFRQSASQGLPCPRPQWFTEKHPTVLFIQTHASPAAALSAEPGGLDR